MSASLRPFASTPRVTATLGLGLLAALGCTAAPDEPARSEDDITAGQIVAGTSPYYWADVSWAEHAAALRAAGEPDETRFVPDDDPLRVRLQALADRFDAALRLTTGNRVAPRPVVRVLATAVTYNAWSSGTLARLGAPFGPASGGTRHVGLVGFQSPLAAPDGEDWSFYGSALPKPAAWTRPASFTQLYDLARGPCRLATREGRVQADEGCQLSGLAADDVGTVATSPFVTFGSDLVSLLGEDGITFVMAHELAHLYRAHSSPLVDRKYAFWYDDGARSALRPVPVAEAAELTATYARLQHPESPLTTLEGAARPARARLPLVVLAAHGAYAGCASYDAWAATNAIGTLWTSASAGAFGSDWLRDAYLGLERAAGACPGDATVGAGVADALQRDAALTPEMLPRADETVAAFVARLDAVSERLAAEERTFLGRVADNRLGFYTTEQEADEVALELLARVGVPVEQGLEGWLGFLKAMEGLGGPAPAEPGVPAEPSAATCESWYRAGFVAPDATGREAPVRVPIGSLESRHHGNCYRLYNLWRESKAHRYGRYAKLEDAPTWATPWSTVAAHAKALTDDAARSGH